MDDLENALNDFRAQGFFEKQEIEQRKKEQNSKRALNDVKVGVKRGAAQRDASVSSQQSNGDHKRQKGADQKNS